MRRIKFGPEEILRENAIIYNDYYKDGIVDGWEPQDKDYNFFHLVKVARLAKKPIENTSVLDVGCGSGDFIPSLRKRNIRSYLGVDIYRPALQLAKHKYPKEQFLLADILEDNMRRKTCLPAGRFDFVFCSGGLSIKLQSVDNYDFFTAMVMKMWQMTRHGLAFNILTDEDIDPAKHLFYYSIGRVRKICKTIAPKAKIRIVRTPIKNSGYLDEAQVHVYMILPKN